MPTLNRSIRPSITTQGNTSTPSVVQLLVLDENLARETGSEFVRVRACNSGGYANSTNATIAPSGGCTTVETHTADKDLTIKSSVLATATGTLTISGVVVDTQTVTIGTRVYEFDTHSTETITATRVRANISASAVKAQGTLTLPTIPVAGDSMQIGLQTYAFVASGAGDSPGEISIGANVAAAQVNIVAAINGTDGFNTANPLVSAAAFAANVCTLTAKAGGVIGNSIVTTQAITPADGVFNAATLGTTTAGVDCSAANAVTALVAAITGDASAVVTAADGAGDTVVVTSKTSGTAGNAIATAETMTNGAWAGGATFLSGGTASLPGLISVAVTDGTAETVTIRFGPPSLSAQVGNYERTQNVTHAAP